jgi:hypothetical protein
MAQAAQGVDDAYKAFRAYGGDMAAVSGERLRTLVGYMKAALRLSDRDVAADVSPRTIAALRYFIRQTGAVPTRGHQITRMNLRRLEQLRRRLGSYIDAAKKEGGPDYGNLTVMKKAFDDWVSDTLDDGFFSGNAKALDAIKFARDKNTEFWKTWKGRDLERDAQTTWEKILNENYTSKEVADWIYGTTSLGESGRPVRLIKHIKDVFGEASNEWQTLRQGVFIRAFYGTARDPMKVGPQKAASNLGQALSDAAALYMNELFSPAELALMRRLQTGIQRFVPPRQMTNRPGSAWAGVRELMALWDKLKVTLPFIAAGSGDPFVAGAIVAGAAGSVARKTATNRAATNAIRGYVLPPFRVRSFGAAGAAGGGQIDRR